MEPFTSDEGVRYELWTEGGVAGFKATHPDGRTRYVFLNPSSDIGEAPGVVYGNVFVYEGGTGDPGQDGTVVFVDVFRESAREVAGHLPGCVAGVTVDRTMVCNQCGERVRS